MDASLKRSWNVGSLSEFHRATGLHVAVIELEVEDKRLGGRTPSGAKRQNEKRTVSPPQYSSHPSPLLR